MSRSIKPLLSFAIAFITCCHRVFATDIEAGPWLQRLQTNLSQLNNGERVATVGGGFRVRYHKEQNFRPTTALPNRIGLTGADDSFLLKRTRLWFNHAPTDSFRVYTELMDAVSVNETHLPRGLDENRLDLHQLYIDTDLNDSLHIKVGRQNVGMGSQRILSSGLAASPEWANARRAHDGIVFEKQVSTGILKSFWLQPVAIQPNQPDRTNHKKSFYGLYLEGEQTETRRTDVYWIAMQDQISGIQTDTLGGFMKGRGRDWQYEFEGGVQLGRQAAGNEYTAGFLFAGLGREFSAPFNGDIWFMYDWGSGSDEPGESFHHNLPLGHRYMGFMDMFGRSNIHDINIRFTSDLTENATLLVWYHYFALANNNTTGPYNVNMTPFAGHPLATTSSRDIGHEIDLRLSIDLREQNNLTVGYSYFFSGSYYNQPGLPYDGNAEFFYAQYEIEF